MKKETYGAKIYLEIEFDGILEDLTKLISSSLNIPDFWFDSDMMPPHEIIAYCEVFGFEIDIKKEDNIYILSATTIEMKNEILNGNLYDLSIWFSVYFNKMTKINSIPKIK